MWDGNSPGSSHPGVKWAATSGMLPAIQLAMRETSEDDLAHVRAEMTVLILRGALWLGLFAIAGLAFVGYITTHAIETALMVIICLAGWLVLAWSVPSDADD